LKCESQSNNTVKRKRDSRKRKRESCKRKRDPKRNVEVKVVMAPSYLKSW